VEIQHSSAALESWTAIEYDLAHTKMDAGGQGSAEAKMRSAGIDADGVRARLGIDGASA
jgi:hypothetical protein